MSRSAGFGDDILPEDIRKLWNAREAASRFLSFMAWGLHVDFWEDDFPEPLKRSLIEGSFAWHRKKGTRWSIQEILRFLNVDTEVQEWQEYGGRPYTFRVKAIVRHPLHPCESWGQETYKRIRTAIIETKPLRAWLDDLIIKILFDFGSITPRLRHALRRELRTARTAWSLWPRFDFVDADAIPLDWNPWSALRRELRTARASRGLTGVSHLDRGFRFDMLPADFLPMDIAMPYFEADTPPILVPFRWRVRRESPTEDVPSQGLCWASPKCFPDPGQRWAVLRRPHAGWIAMWGSTLFRRILFRWTALFHTKKERKDGKYDER